MNRYKNTEVSLVLIAFYIVLFSIVTIATITYCEFVASVPSSSRSGVSGTVVTVDDEKADLYYYNSLNYTETGGS